MKTGSSDTFSPGEANMPAYSDERLVLEALDDSHPAFEQLVKQYQYRVLRTIASIISDEQAAQDIAQETFLSAWSDLAKLREREKFGRWLNRIAVNLSRDWLRDQRKHNDNRVPLDEDAIVLTQELRYRRDKLRQTVWEAIDELSEDHREVVILHYISGYSYKEIGEMLSVPFSTVSGRLQKAKDQLRKEFLDMVTKLQFEIDSTLHGFLKEHAKQDGVSVEGLIIRLIERYKRDIDSPEIAVRQAWGPERKPITDVLGAPSPDGSYLSFTEWYSANLAVRDLTTGEHRVITNEGTWDKPGHWASYSIWSPDGKQIAYGWCSYLEHMELRIVGLDGSEPRVLYRNESKEVKRIRPHAWSQDGNSILAWIGRVPGPSEIVLISVADGSVRVLKSVGVDRPIKMDISPDGRYIVYDHSVDFYSPRDIFLLATDGSGEEVPLVEHPANDYGPVWSPDGKSIVFASDRSGTYGAWLMQVLDGKPVGEPQLVKRDMGAMLPMGFTREGPLYYGLSAGLEDVYVVSLDPATGKLLAPPTKVSHRFEGFNSSPAWSPDGRYLAYRSRRWPVPTGAAGLANRVLVVRSAETGEELVFTAQGAVLRRMRWSPDGRSLLCEAGENREFHLTLIDAQTGDVTFIVPRDGKGEIRNYEWRPDGKAIFCIKGPEYSESIVMHDLETGKEKELWQEGVHWVGLGISPDGRQLVFGKDDKTLMVIAVEGGEPRILHRLQEGEFAFLCSPTWTADGRYVLFGKRNPNELWRIPAEGGEAQKLLEMEEGLRSISVHPDGQRIAFAGGGQHTSEVWVMENFLPGFAPSK